MRGDEDVDACPSASCARMSREPVAERNRDSDSMRTGRSAKRSRKFAGMLLGQQRGGHQHRHLPAGLHGDEGGAHGHFGLAEAHVAADHAVHGSFAGQVLQHAVDGLGLVGGFLEGKGRGEGPVLALRRPPARCPCAPAAARTGPAVRRPRRAPARWRGAGPSPTGRCRACAAARRRAQRRCSG